MEEKISKLDVLTGFVAIIAAGLVLGSAGYGLYLMFKADYREREAQEVIFQRDLTRLGCVHTGYRGRGETKIYTCNGRLMERGRDGLKYSY